MQCTTVFDVTVTPDGLFFTDVGARKIGKLDTDSRLCSYVAGTGEGDQSKDGSDLGANFLQPLGLCGEERSLFVCDSAVGSVKLVTPTECLISYLQQM